MYTTVQLQPEAAAPSLPPRRRLRRAGITALSAVAVAGTLAITAHVVAHEDTATETYLGIRAVILDTDAGTIDVSAAEGAATTVTGTHRWSYQAPSARPVRDGDRLIISARCPKIEHAAGFGTCHTNYQLAVPAGVEVQVTTSAGTITGSDLAATQFTARTSNGDISLSFTGMPESVQAHSSAGDVRVAVPYGSYHVDADTSAGDVEVGVVSNPRAPRLIDAHTAAGDVEVSPR
jgi:hypothetical protein